MSLKDLWAAHAPGCAVKDPCIALKHTSAAMDSPSVALQTRKRAREDSSKAGPTQARSRVSTRTLPAGETDLGLGSILTVKPRAFPQHQQLFKTLQAEVQWLDKEVTMFGRKVMQPRQVAYMADNAGLSYTYSHTKMTPAGWHPDVEYVKAKLEKIAGTSFNSCLLNLYRDGKDHMGWHSDNEKLYGDNPVIGSVSFGAARRFLLRSNEDHRTKWEYTLASGDVLIMMGTTQLHWTHSIPKGAQVSFPRINLTFRQIKHPELQ